MMVNKISPNNMIKSHVIKSANDTNSKKFDFKDLLTESIDKINKSQLEAEKLSGEFISGKTENFTEMLIAEQKAELSLTLATEFRNKLLESYKEIMRMQI